MLTSTQKQILGLAALAIALTRIQISVGALPVPVTLALVPAAMAALFFFGRVRIDPVAALLVVAICANGCISFLLNGQGSVPSLMLIVYLYAVAAFVTETDPAGKQAFDRAVVKMGAILAAIGIAQFLLQWAIPAEYLFSWKKFLPKTVLVEYNTLNELFYQAGIFKSNGFFFLESSQFGMFLARILSLSIIANSMTGAIFIAAATLLSYSGTAWLTFIIFMALYLVSAVFGLVKVPRWLMVFFAVAGVAVVIASPVLHLDRYAARVQEVETGSVRSSGGQRFNVPLDLTVRFLKESGAPNILFGLGPGMVDSYFGITRYSVVASPWSKLIVEYGLTGLLLFTALLYRMVSRSTRNLALQLSIMISFIFIDPGLLLASAVYPLYLLFCCMVVRPSPGIGEV